MHPGYRSEVASPVESRTGDLLHDYRLRIIRIGLVLSFAALAIIGAVLLGEPRRPSPSTIAVLSLCALAVIVLTFAPWRRLLASRTADLVIGLWAVAVVLALVSIQTAGGGPPDAIGLLMVTIFAAATLSSTGLLFLIAALALAGYAYVVVDNGEMSLGSSVVLVAAFAAAAMLILLLGESIKAQLTRTGSRLTVLERRERSLQEKERELTSLYDVSATIGAGSNLVEVLPELVGRVAHALEATTGLVLLYRPNEERLEVMSPIWVSGHTVGAEGYSLPLTEGGLAQRVFISGDSALDNEVGRDAADRLLVDLGAHKIAAVPLRVEQKRIGVLLVADRHPADFTREDLATLEALAAPAALVLNQMARYEEARQTGVKMAELARLKTDFVSVVSHELRTPLTSIIGSLRTLQRPELAPADPNAVELIAAASKQANRLRKLIENLLVVSRLDAEALPMHPESLSPRPFMEEVVAAIPGAAGRVRTEISRDVTRLDADPDHLARILTNLVENAIRHSGDGAVTVRAGLEGGEVRLSVIDHGTGIPYDRREHVFDRFTQLQPIETRSRGGSGLGLFIVRGLAEAMGGRVWYEPTIGGGSTFVVALPSVEVKAAG
jgi:signal transduction histidine kinase